jgi:hypothetical protein
MSLFLMFDVVGESNGILNAADNDDGDEADKKSINN